MGVIATNKNQLTFIYSSNTHEGKRTLGYLSGINKPYLTIDLAKTKVSDTQWVEIARKLNVSVGDLVEKSQMNTEIESTADFDETDWIKVIQNNDSVIIHPIAIMGDRIAQIMEAREIMAFFEVDSAGLEQSPSEGNSLDVERTTDDENFLE